MPPRRYYRRPARRTRPRTYASRRAVLPRTRNTAVSKCFNPVAGRPNAILRTLTPKLQCQFTEVISPFLTTSMVAFTFAARAFQASDVSTAGFLTLFDQYRIDQIEVWIEPRAAQGSTVFSNISTRVDLDDVSTPTVIENVEHGPGALTTAGGNGHYHKWVPHMAMAAYSGVFTSFTNREPQWIDSASSGVQHFGIKMGAFATAAVVNYDMSVRFTMSFRAPGFQ